MDDATRKRLLDKSGAVEQVKFPKYEVPTISMDGNRGEFQRKELDGTITPLKDPKVVILKVRNTLGTKMGDTGPELFSTEFSSPNDNVALFEKVAGKVVAHGVGQPTYFRGKFPNIKTVVQLYVLHNGDVCKIPLRGTSAANFFDFRKLMGEQDKHSIDYTLGLGAKEGMHEKTKKKYFSTTFTDHELDADTSVLETRLDEVNAAVAKMDEYMRARVASAGTSVAVATPAAKDDINPDDIPF